MRTLVIGGTGNISFGIVHALLERGHEVTVYTRGQRDDDLPAGVERVTGDRQDRGAFEALLRDRGFDGVIDMIAFTEADVASAVRGLEGTSLQHYLFCSTVCALGVDFDAVPTPEDHPYRPNSDYGRNKAAAERLLLAAHRDRGFPVTVMRPSYTYGRIPTLRQLGFDLTIVDRLRQGLPVVVSDDAETLQWQALDHRDAGQAFAMALGEQGCFGEVLNVVGDDHFSWAELHRALARAADAPEPVLVPLPREEIVARQYPGFEVFRDISAYTGWYDDSKIRRLLPGFRQQIPFERGIRESIQWLESRGQLRPAVPSWEDEVAPASLRA